MCTSFLINKKNKRERKETWALFLKIFLFFHLFFITFELSCLKKIFLPPDWIKYIRDFYGSIRKESKLFKVKDIYEPSMKPWKSRRRTSLGKTKKMICSTKMVENLARKRSKQEILTIPVLCQGFYGRQVSFFT